MCLFDEFLNDVYGESVSICGATFDTANAFQRLDPIAYRVAVDDWIDSQIQDFCYEHRVDNYQRFGIGEKITTIEDYVRDCLENEKQPDFSELDSLEPELIHTTESAIDVYQICEAKFWEMLEVLPPENYHNTNGLVFFQMCEYNHANFTNYYVQKGDEFFSFEFVAWANAQSVESIINDNHEEQIREA